MRVVGHRGCRLQGLDNTVAGVRRAWQAGADGVELDVRRGSGGELVCAHDPAAGGPRLESLLDASRGRGLVICEVKNVPGQRDYDGARCATADALVGLLNRRTGDDVVVSSFDSRSISRAAEAGLRTALLTSRWEGVSQAAARALDDGHEKSTLTCDAFRSPEGGGMGAAGRSDGHGVDGWA